jgi:aspartyl-tRNA(Asn)/glutamyl-tRNA(Gln) amidotransferase subunit C
MSLSESDVTRIARLARIELSPEETVATLAQLNGIFTLIEQMKSLDTSAVEPLATPLAAAREVTLRLRDDAVTESDRRDDFQACAPALAEGLYLVPRVLD